MISRLSIFLLTLCLIGCSPGPVSVPSVTPPPIAPTSLPSTADEAHDMLVNFLTWLHTKNYTDAVPLYGGEYEQLQIFNTEIDPNDPVALWAWACDHQLLQCLEVRSATFKELRGDSYIFQVAFTTRMAICSCSVPAVERMRQKCHLSRNLNIR